MRHHLPVLCLVAVTSCGDTTKETPKAIDVDCVSGVRTPPVPLNEGKVYQFTLKGKLGDKEKLTLTLDPNARTFDEAGQVSGSTEKGLTTLELTATFVKMAKLRPRFANPPTPILRPLFKLEGKGLKSKLALLGPEGGAGTPRLLVQDEDGKVVHVVEFEAKVVDITPCHPGCFPAGTPVATPRGPRMVDAVRVGDEVTTVSADGVAGRVKVTSIFVTTNRLLKVETEGGTLFTTPTQPLCRTDGKVIAAESLEAGDAVYRWADGKRVAATVKAVGPSGRTEKVFNLVLGDSEVFVAGGFLARSKPPAAE